MYAIARFAPFRLVVVVLALMFQVSCGITNHNSAATAQPALGAPPAVSPAGAAPTGRPTNQAEDAELRVLRAANLNQQLVPARWTQCCGESVLTRQELYGSTCVDLRAQVAGLSYQFGFDLVNGVEREHLQSTVRSTSTPTETAAILTAIGGAAEDACVKSATASDLPGALPTGAVVGAPTITRIDRHLPLAGQTRLYAVPYTTNGRTHTFYTDWINMASGRLRVTLRISGRVAGSGESLWEQAVAACGEPALITTAAQMLADSQAVRA
jgi:hypothetical protein